MSELELAAASKKAREEAVAAVRTPLHEEVEKLSLEMKWASDSIIVLQSKMIDPERFRQFMVESLNEHVDHLKADVKTDKKYWVKTFASGIMSGIATRNCALMTQVNNVIDVAEAMYDKIKERSKTWES